MSLDTNGNDIQIAVDVKDAVIDINALSDALKELAGNGLGNVISKTGKFNTAGETIGFALTQLAITGQKTTTVFKSFVDELEDDAVKFAAVSQTISQATSATQRLDRARERAFQASQARSDKYTKDAEQQQKANTTIRDSVLQLQAAQAQTTGKTVRPGSQRELNNLDAAIARATAPIGQKNIDAKQVIDTFVKLTAGITTFTGRQEKLLPGLRKVIEAAEQIGTSYETSAAKSVKAGNAQLASLTKEANALLAVENASRHAGEAEQKRILQSRAREADKQITRQVIELDHPVSANATPAELGSVQTAINRVVNNIGKNGIDGNQVIAVFEKLKAGGTQFEGIEAQIARQFEAVAVAASNTGSAASKAANDAVTAGNRQLENLKKQSSAFDELQAKQAFAAGKPARQAQAFDTLTQKRNNAGGLIDASLNTKANGSQSELNAVQSAIAKVTNNIGKNGVTDTKVIDVLTRMNAGATQFLGVEAKIVEQLNRVSQAAAKVGTNYQAGLDTAAAANKKFLDSLAALGKKFAEKKVAEAVTTGRNNDADIGIARTQSLFSGALKSANPAQTQAFNVAIQGSVKLLRDGKVTLDQFNTALNNIKSGKIKTETNPALVELQSKLLAVKEAFAVTGSAGEKAGSGIFLSFQNVIRIFEAQVIYAAFSKIQSAFTEATQNAAEYSKQIALIQTISQDSGLSTSEWAQQVRGLSDALGTPITDTAAAAYEALSNQVAKGADAFQFLATAGQLARTTGSKLEDSVDLISSALNSFELDTSQAERAAKSFFTTIDLGRVKIPELANSFGRSGVLAHQLGVELEELNSTISVLTRQGIKANEAYTLINNLFQKLIKPTEATEGFFRRIGVSSAQDAFETLKLVGVLKALRKEFESNPALQGELFPEIRGGRAARNLTSGLDEVIKDLDANNKSGPQFDIAKNIVNESDGKKLEDQFNKIRNFFTQDVGGDFLRKVIALSDSIGGLANAVQKVVNVTKTLVVLGLGIYSVTKIFATVQAVGTLAQAITALRATTALTSAGFVAFGVTASAATAVATAGISILVAALAAIVISQTQFGESAESNLRRLTDAYQSEADEQTRIFGEALSKQTQEFKEAFDNSKTAFLKFASTIRVELFKVTDGLKASASKIKDGVKSQFDVVSGLIRNNLGELEGKLKKLTNTIEILKNASRDSTNSFNSSVFDRNLQYNDTNVKNGFADKTFPIFTQRIDELRSQAKIKFIDQKDIEGGLKLLEEAGNLAAKLALTERNDSLPFRIVGERLLLDIERSKLDVIKESISVQEKAKQLVEEQVNAQRKLFEQLQEAEKHVVEFDPLGKDGKLLAKFASPDAAIKDLDDKQKTVIDLLDRIEAGIDTKIHTVGEFSKQRADLLKSFQQQGGNNTDLLRSNEQLTQTNVASADVITQNEAILKAIGKINEARVENNQLQIDAIKNTKTQLGLTLSQVGESLPRFVGIPGTVDPIEVGKKDIPQFQILKKTQDALTSLKPGSEDIDAFKKQFGGIKNQLITQLPNVIGQQTGGKTKDGKDATVDNSIASIEASIKAFEESQKANVKLDEALRSIEAQQSVLNKKALAIDPNFKLLEQTGVAAGANIETALSKATLGVEKLQEATLKTIESLEKLKSLSNGVEEGKIKRGVLPAPGAPEVGTFSDGGFIDDFINRKYAKGTDIIPAMLGRGERVLTKSQNQDYTNLISGNSFTPRLTTGRSQVTNRSTNTTSTTNVGDINITVSGGSTSTDTAQKIGNVLRRGIRQGTIRLT